MMMGLPADPSTYDDASLVDLAKDAIARNDIKDASRVCTEILRRNRDQRGRELAEEFFRSKENGVGNRERNLLPGAQSPSGISQINMVTSRYRDAYTVARATIGIAKFIKVAAIVFALLGPVLSFALYSTVGLVALGAIPFSLIAAGIAYSLGMLVAAGGQMILASADIAVNTSPLLTAEQKERIVVGRNI
jgi:hypothetical protein